MRFAAIILCALCLAGCGVGGGVVATENDRLRAQVLDLESQVRTLTSRNAELQTQLALASRAQESVPPEILANTPRITSISLSRLSQARDEDGDGRLDSIILYLEPADGLGRFLQIVGSVSMHAAVLPPDGPAQTIGQRTIGPDELRAAYRSAFTGQYYSLTLPIEPREVTPAPQPPPPPPSGAPATMVIEPVAVVGPESPLTQCTVRVEYIDGYTGQRFAAERVIDLR